MPIRTLLANPYHSITLDEESGLVRVVRYETPFASAEEAVRLIEPAMVLISQSSGPRRYLLLDVRRAPGRNDPEFERAIFPLFMRHFRGFVRMAVVAQSAVGRLQLQRMSRMLGRGGLEVFASEEEALVYLHGG